MLVTWANCSGGLNAGLSFWLPLDDLGAGAVNTTPASAAGSATPSFARATTATTILSNGLIGSVASGTARSCYSPAGVYLGYLAEEARTNIALQSTFGATWVVSNATLTPNVGTSPDGTANAATLTEAAVTNTHVAVQTFTKAASALAYTATVWAKAGLRSQVGIALDNGSASAGIICFFNLSNGVAGTPGAGGTYVTTLFSGATASMTAFPNGWYRCTLTATSDAGTTLRMQITPSDGSGSFSYAGTAGCGVSLFGAQLEQAAFATSYIPTTTVAVARNADVLTYPTAGNILGALGSCYAESTWANTAATSGPDILDTFPSAIQMNLSGTAAIGLYDGSSRVPGPTLTTSAATAQKVATRWDGGAGFCNAAGNGTLGTPAAWVTPTLGATMYLGNRQGGGGNVIGGTIRNLRIWTRALADSQLVSLTS